jgi:hypothetical protein
MQRFQRTTLPAIQADELYASDAVAGAVPASFAEWLAQSTCDIMAGLEPGQGALARSPNQSATRHISRDPSIPFHR